MPMDTLAASDFDEASAEAEKKRISKAIRPDRSLIDLPPLRSKPRRVLLIVPPGTVEESYGRLSAAAGELPMLGLAYIAAADLVEAVADRLPLICHVGQVDEEVVRQRAFAVG